MFEINVTDITQVSGSSFVTEASDVGLEPGEWPDFLVVTGGILFQRGTADECGSYRYWSKQGESLLVINS